jgi:hypothetical protein
MTKPETCIVVLGLDADKKPRAAKFDVADEKTVRKAAAAQGLKIGRPKTDEATELALRLVDGRIYTSGKGLMPLVNAVPRDNQGERSASIRMRKRRGWADGGRA